MKILIINTFYYPNIIGGTENSVKLLAENLVEKGNKVAVYTCDSKKEFYYENINGVEVYRGKGMKSYSVFDRMAGLNLKNKINYKLKELRNIYAANEIDVVLKNFQPDIINTNNLFGISPYIWLYLKKKKFKIIHTIRDYWLMCPKTTLLNRNDEICTKENILCKLYRKYFKEMTKYVDIVTAPSEFTLQHHIKNGYFINAKCYSIFNAISFNINDVKNISNEKAKRCKNIITFLFIGNLLKSKGIKYLLDSFTKVENPNIELIICGSGVLENMVKEYTKRDYRIKYLGRVIGNSKKIILEKSDVLIVPSIWYEPFGRVVIEAYKYGMPVIGTNLGGLTEIINDKITGLIVNYDSKEELINAIMYLSNRNNIIQLINNIPDFMQQFSISRQIERFEEIYNLL